MGSLNVSDCAASVINCWGMNQSVAWRGGLELMEIELNGSAGDGPEMSKWSWCCTREGHSAWGENGHFFFFKDGTLMLPPLRPAQKAQRKIQVDKTWQLVPALLNLSGGRGQAEGRQQRERERGVGNWRWKSLRIFCLTWICFVELVSLRTGVPCLV